MRQRNAFEILEGEAAQFIQPGAGKKTQEGEPDPGVVPSATGLSALGEKPFRGEDPGQLFLAKGLAIFPSIDTDFLHKAGIVKIGKGITGQNFVLDGNRKQSTHEGAFLLQGFGGVPPGFALVAQPCGGVLPGHGGGGFIGQEMGQGLDQGLHLLHGPGAPFAVLMPIVQQALPTECGVLLFQRDIGQFRAGDRFPRLTPTQVPGGGPEGGGKGFETCVQSPVIDVPSGGQMQEMRDVDFELLQESDVSGDSGRGKISDKIRALSRISKRSSASSPGIPGASWEAINCRYSASSSCMMEAYISCAAC